MVRKAWVPTSQLLVRVHIDRDTNGLWLESQLVPRGSRLHPALSGTILGQATMEWTCVRNGLEIVRKAESLLRNYWCQYKWIEILTAYS